MQNSDPTHIIKCAACHSSTQIQAAVAPTFCPNCGHVQPTNLNTNQLIAPPYEILETIGKGGMGEVFAAFDPHCKRRIALKRIRPDLIEHPQIRHRFLKEAHITCQLTHPAIIPIYTIVSSPETVFYTMPLVEGKTLKEIIRRTKQQEKNGEKIDQTGGSIPALMHIFMTVCQAVAYAHSKKVIHRDLKPENIIVGKYGEVLILDWGLAKWIDHEEDELDINYPSPTQAIQDLYHTKVGKVVGTISYMAPERAKGIPATVQTDIYSLGVILYQILTLKNPFKRKTLEEFRRNVDREELIDPLVIAPHRDVPKMLVQYTLKCLEKSPEDRYKTVDELVHDLTTYVEGRSEWFYVASLDAKNKEDWEFQENILITEHAAITQTTEETEWVSLMISHQSFPGNTKFEASITLGENNYGIGFLFSIPEASERTHLNEGYCLWLGSDSHRTTKLLRSNVEIMQAPDIFLKREQSYNVRIEVIEKSIHFYINDVLQFSYVAHLPLIGTHIGLLSRDADFEIKSLDVYVGSLNLNVNCLAVPDAFLAHEDYPKALSEYKRIAHSFPDRAEGREAQFRAGLTYIEQAKCSDGHVHLLTEALEEFEKLHGTPSAPLQYLGKALVYEILNENEEEIKCFELAYRRYPNHPLLLVLQEHILSRMQEVSRKDRLATYRFISLVMRHLPSTAIDNSTQRIFKNLQKHWEILPFIQQDESEKLDSWRVHLAIPLLFWLGKPYAMEEIIENLLTQEPLNSVELCNAIFCFLEWGAWDLAGEKLNKIQSKIESLELLKIENCIATHHKPLEEVAAAFQLDSPSSPSFSSLRAISYFIDRALDQGKTTLALFCLNEIHVEELSLELRIKFHCHYIWAYLLDRNWQKASEIFALYPLDFLNKDCSLLYFLYGCWLDCTEGNEISTIHFNGLFLNTYPRSWSLGAHYLVHHISLTGQWTNQAFIWEKKQLYRQLSLYYHCTNDLHKKLEFQQLYNEVHVHAEF